MNSKLEGLYRNLTGNLLGCEKASMLLTVGLLAEGHVLIQGPPGVGKTSLAKTMAASVHCRFRRIQFTPDLLPSDILGYALYDRELKTSVFHRGPVFGHVVLADEINRASPRTQSALLECMNESQVTVEGTTYELEPPFFVVATENHRSSAGAVPLPAAQLDRFLLSFDMPSPSHDVQVKILEFHADAGPAPDVPPVLAREELLAMQAEVRGVQTAAPVLAYVVSLCEAVRHHASLVGGPSPRAAIGLMNAAKALAYLDDRTAAYPDDVKKAMPHVLRHRLVHKTGRGHDTHRTEAVLREILDATPVPMEVS